MSSEPAPPILHTVTSTTLLEGLRTPDNRVVWQQFDGRYRPVIVSIARRRGLSESDADDCAQRALLDFFQAYRDGKYDRAKGRLRHWLLGIARNRISNSMRGSAKRELQAINTTSQTDIFERQVDPQGDDQLDQIELDEWRKGVFQECYAQAIRNFDGKTVEAFDLFARQGWSAQAVADQLGMTANAVFLAKHKIVNRIRELLPQVDEVW